jgi:uncharacterized protein DUF397
VRACRSAQTYSGGNGGNCVEVASTAGVVLVRDTTDRAGAVLAIPAAAWERFTARQAAELAQTSAHLGYCW